jgi:FtsH-binding integral membrane protein
MILYSIWAIIGLICMSIVLWLDHNNDSKCNKYKIMFATMIGLIGGPIFIPMLYYFKQDIKDTWRKS